MDPIKFNKPNLEAFTKDKEPIPDIVNNIIDKIVEDYIEDITAAVATLDINNLKAVVNKWQNKGIGKYFCLPSDEVLEITIRKMAVNMTNISEDIQEEAKAWLLARGYDLKLE
jgi:hypothetical protein